MTSLQSPHAPKVRRQDLLILFGLACLIRLLTAWPQQQPNYMDAAYSYVNALNLLAGRGFVEDFVWNYLGQPGPPPQPSHLYWMPLTSILAWLGMAVGGASYRAAQIPFVLLSALLAPIAYLVAYHLSGQRRLAWLAGLLAIFSGFYFPYWTAIDNFTPFAITGSLALLAAWQGMEGVGSKEYAVRTDEHGLKQSNPQPPTLNPQPPLWLFAAGIFAGLAHLARADGPLVLISILLLYLLRFMIYDLRFTIYDLRLTSHASRLTSHASRLTLLLLGYLLIMTPWFIRNWQVTGAFLPAAGSQTIWLNNYDELFSYGRELSARTFLAQGLGPALQGRWWALTINLQTVLAVWGMIFLAPLALLGGWSLRRHGLIQLAGLYAALLFAVMTLFFAFPGARGGLFHSGAALLPFIYATALVGLEQAIEWIAARRRRWDAAVAKQFFGVGLVLIAVGLSSFIYYGRVLKNNAWNSADALYPAIAAWVAQANPTATVMIGNPPAYRYHGGGLSVIVPNENITTTLQAARRYKADYLILDHNHPAPLTAIYTKTVTHSGLSLVQTFTDDTGQPVYIFKLNQQ
ncbi:MAG: hypothetical protein DPW09_03305 [Anaerolineae bacterium]|nr:hypothetical protein [Anaerolineales bacterium]MCQ3972458.1 hypothetical protein [Anaerolineae bacterium]